MFAVIVVEGCFWFFCVFNDCMYFMPTRKGLMNCDDSIHCYFMLLPVAVNPETSTRLTAVWKGEPARSVKHSVKCLGRERFSREAVLCNVPLSAEMLSVLAQMTASEGAIASVQLGLWSSKANQSFT